MYLYMICYNIRPDTHIQTNYRLANDNIEFSYTSHSVLPSRFIVLLHTLFYLVFFLLSSLYFFYLICTCQIHLQYNISIHDTHDVYKNKWANGLCTPVLYRAAIHTHTCVCRFVWSVPPGVLVGWLTG